MSAIAAMAFGQGHHLDNNFLGYGLAVPCPNPACILHLMYSGHTLDDRLRRFFCHFRRMPEIHLPPAILQAPLLGHTGGLPQRVSLYDGCAVRERNRQNRARAEPCGSVLCENINRTAFPAEAAFESHNNDKIQPVHPSKYVVWKLHALPPSP